MVVAVRPGACVAGPSVADTPARGPSAVWLAAMPFAFVLLWSTGFIVAKVAAPYAPPLTFLLYRFAGVIVVLLPLAWLTRAPWPRSPRAWWDTILVGVLLQATYLGGVWVAIALGMPAGVSSLLVGTQPLLTALFGATVGERVTRLQWVGLLLGIIGITLVLSDRLTLAGVGPLALAVNGLALVGITAGTLYQKRRGAHDRSAHRQCHSVRRFLCRAAAVRRGFRIARRESHHRILGGAGVVDRRAVAGGDLAAAGYDPPRPCHRSGQPDVPDAGRDRAARMAGLRGAPGLDGLGRCGGHDGRRGAGAAR